MTLETIKLAGEFETRSARARKLTEELAAEDKAEKDRQKKWEADRRAKKGKLAELHRAVKLAGDAQRELMLAVPAELREAVDLAERKERKAASLETDARAFVEQVKLELAAAKEATPKVEDAALEAFTAKVEEAEAKALELKKELAAARDRVTKTRAAARAAHGELVAKLKADAAPAAAPKK